MMLGGGVSSEPHNNESGGGTGGGGGASGGSSTDVGGGASSSVVPTAMMMNMDELISERSGGGGNRWPRQETLALLKIRSDMDVAFRDSSLKGPLWEEVSRKMAELGFQRSAKKCKEKFENVYKYHKRTKDGRATKSDGKSYRFFDQLEALENSPPISFGPPPPPQQRPSMAAAPPPNAANSSMPPTHNITVTSSSTSPNPLTIVPPNNTTTQTTIGSNLMNPSLFQQTTTIIQPPPPMPQIINAPSNPPPFQSITHLSNSTSSSTSSDEDIQMRRGKKRKWKDFFGRLMKDVIQKQEELQNKFLDTLERRERDRMAREEAWRVQEMARMNREHDLLVQERSVAATKDSAVIAFLQKVTEQHNIQIPINDNNANVNPPPHQATIQQVQQSVENPPRKPPPPPVPAPTPPPTTTPTPTPTPPPPPVMALTPLTKTLEITKTDNGGGDSFNAASSSRWPKAEVEALIKLRTNLELKYQENGPKGPLWEEISSAMAKIGYNRSSKRCKEKWENINKYFKKVKESNKKRPEDSKTCPYFHQLDAIYKERAKHEIPINTFNPMVPIMAQPEQQWPLPVQQQQQQRDSAIHDQDRGNDSDDDDNNDREDEDDDEDDEEDDDQGGGYEIVTNNKQQQQVSNSVTNAVE